MSGLWSLAWRAIRGRPLRSASTAAAVALGIAVVLGVQVTLDGLTSQATAAQQLAAGQSGLDVRVDAGGGLTTAQAASLASLKGVAQAMPLYEKRVVAGPAGTGLQGLTVTLVGLKDGAAALRPLVVVGGRLPHPGSASEVAIDQALAPAMTGRAGKPLAIGSRIQIITSTGPDQYRVVGFTSGTSGGPAFTRSAVFVDDAAMLGTFRLGLRTPLVALRLLPGVSPVTVAAEVQHRLGQTVTAAEPGGAGLAPLADLRPLLVLVTLLSVIIGAGVTANSGALAVLERRRDIGLLRAAGASSRQVFRLFAAESITVAACGIPAGVGIGIALGALLSSHYAAADLPATGLALGAGEIVAAIVAGFGAAVVGGMIPAVVAGRLPVLEALRFRPAAERQRAPLAFAILAPIALLVAAICFAATSSGLVALGVALFLLGVGLALPIVVPVLARALAWISSPLAPVARVAAGGLQRTRNRTALTAAGLSVSVATAVAISVLTAGALTASDGWVSRLFVGDTVITSAVTQSDAVAGAIQGSPTVQLATPLRIFTEPVAGTSLAIAAIDPAVYETRGGLDVLTPDRKAALASLENGPEFLAPQPLAAASGWTVGTQLPVQTESGVVYFTIAGIVSHSFPAGDGGESLVMANDLAGTYFGATASGFDDLVVVSQGSPQGVEAVAATYGLQAVPVDSIAQAARDALQHSIGLLLVLAIVSVTIAMLAVVNTLVVNARQRTRELALLRAVGLSHKQAVRLVLAEAGLLAATATLIGVAAGCIIALPMLRASASPGFDPAFAFPAATAIALVLAIVAAALLAALGPARRAASASVLTELRQD
ncbi:MAG: FtsX-like permease family protein [Chloroflexi bacterium]|nr:MAG: FtsX-like permease family protein [Chloroflexota bacterium]